MCIRDSLETDVINTEGYAYGVECQGNKPSGKLNGWASYTYSRTCLRQNDPRIARPVNGGDWYPTEYDKPHDFKLVGNYKFTRRYSCLLYTSGDGTFGSISINCSISGYTDTDTEF